jgi:ribosomal protein L11 methyltransferase
LGKSAALALRFANDDQTTRELLAAEIDGSIASAIHETTPHEWRVFYPTITERDAAGTALAAFCRAHSIALDSLEIDDEDWARRSQTQLKAVRVGDIIIAPPWDMPPGPPAFFPARGAPPPLARARRRGSAALPSGASRGPQAPLVVIVIEPSTGFGTGHHASTRLCLMAMQRLDLRGRRIIDVGTGSGVLAIAAVQLGAAHVLAIDTDADAIQNARENVARNSVAVDLRVADAAALAVERADVLLANLTGAWLRRFAERLIALTQPGGTLVVSGLQDWEQMSVLDGFVGLAAVAHSDSEDGWTAVTLERYGN